MRERVRVRVKFPAPTALLEQKKGNPVNPEITRIPVQTITERPCPVARAIAYGRFNARHSGESRNPVNELGSIPQKIKHPARYGLRLSPE